MPFYRKVIRLPEYDYSQNGAYFVTICTKDRKRVLSEIISEPVAAGLRARPQIKLTEIGNVAEESIEFANKNYVGIKIDKYVIMPNHIHMIVLIDREEGGHGGPPLQEVVKRIKSYASVKHGTSIWQRSYYEHVIRNDSDYLDTWQYIDGNPLKWADDEYYN